MTYATSNKWIIKHIGHSLKTCATFLYTHTSNKRLSKRFDRTKRVPSRLYKFRLSSATELDFYYNFSSGSASFYCSSCSRLKPGQTRNPGGKCRGKRKKILILYCKIYIDNFVLYDYYSRRNLCSIYWLHFITQCCSK